MHVINSVRHILTMIKRITYFTLFILLSFTLGGCQEDGDIVNPTIDISAPGEGDVFTISDEIEVVGRATDDISLKNVIISSSLGVNQTISEFDNPSDFPFIFALTLDPNTVAGSYDITIKAVDTSDNEAETSVNITIE